MGDVWYYLMSLFGGGVSGFCRWSRSRSRSRVVCSEGKEEGIGRLSGGSGGSRVGWCW